MSSLLRNFWENVLRASHRIGHLFKFSPVIIFSMHWATRLCKKKERKRKSREKWKRVLFSACARAFPRNDRRTVAYCPRSTWTLVECSFIREEVVAGCRGIYWPRLSKQQQQLVSQLIQFKLKNIADCFYANILVSIQIIRASSFSRRIALKTVNDPWCACDHQILDTDWSLTLFLDMVYLDASKATCRVLDQHPNPTQRKLSFLVSPSTTSVKQFLEQVATQFTYDKFELILETKNVSQLNSRRPCLMLINLTLFLDKPQRSFRCKAVKYWHRIEDNKHINT